ncbi:uncharacterized protein V6R79_009838 [Siganus canaliculatus]
MMPTPESYYDVIQPVYEDPDVLRPIVIDGGQSEVRVKPVPPPRLKRPPGTNESQTTTIPVDAGDKTSNTTNAGSPPPYEYSTDYQKPRPVRPPKPPLNKPIPSSKPAAINGCNGCVIPNTGTAVKPPVVSSNRSDLIPPRVPPERPPLPSVYSDRSLTMTRQTSEIYHDSSQQSRSSSVSSLRSLVSAASSDDVLSYYGSCVSTDSDDADSSLFYSPTQTRPQVPAFSPPPRPSRPCSSLSMYAEIEDRSYLEILPEKNVNVMDIDELLKWLKRVSKCDSMAPSLYGLSLEEETRSFTHRAMNVAKAMRLYNLLMLKRNDKLRCLNTEFRSIADSIDKMQKKSKTMGIAGGATGAVGGVATVVGIALAPVTMGTSLIATAVGAGMVASAGGLGAHAATRANKVVNKTTVQKLVDDYKTNIVDLEHCLDFILLGMTELCRHDIARLQRAGVQTDVLKMAHLSQCVITNHKSNDRKASVAHTGGMSSERLLLSFTKEMDQYFKKQDGRLKRSCEGRFSSRIGLLASNLQDELDHLNRLWEMFC